MTETRGRGATIASLSVSTLCNFLALAAIALLWRYRPGSSIHPMIESTMIVLAGLGSSLFAVPLSVIGIIRTRGQRRWRRLAVLALFLSLSPWVIGFSLWNYVERVHSLTMSD